MHKPSKATYRSWLSEPHRTKSGTATRWRPLIASVLIIYSGIGCDDPIGPSHDVSSDAPVDAQTGLRDNVVIDALKNLAASDGTLLVGLKEASAQTGVTNDGVALSVNARLAAQAEIVNAFPMIAVLDGVRHVVTYRTPEGIRSMTLHRTFIRIRADFTQSLLHQLRAHPNVDYLEPNWTTVVIRSKMVRASAMQGFEQVPWAVDTMRARAAWARGYRGAGISVGMVDTGLDGFGTAHPDISLDNSNWMHHNATWGRYGDNSCTDVNAECYWERPFHGTSVYGAVAAAENGHASVGIAPAAVPVLGTGGATYVNTQGQLAGGGRSTSPTRLTR